MTRSGRAVAARRQLVESGDRRARKTVERGMEDVAILGFAVLHRRRRRPPSTSDLPISDLSVREKWERAGEYSGNAVREVSDNDPHENS